jgi:hypothetical protein
MSPAEAEAFEARCRARQGWPVRSHLLREDVADLLPDEVLPAERLRIAWQLAVEAWQLSGRGLPSYERSQAPARLFRRGERRVDEE